MTVEYLNVKSAEIEIMRHYFGFNASCVYCKNRDHASYYCTMAKDKLELICKYCSGKGHSVDKFQLIICKETIVNIARK